MNCNSIKIGLIPERRYFPNSKQTGMFDPEFAKKCKDKVVKLIRERFTDAQTEFVDLEWLNDEGMLVETSDCGRVAEYLKKENVDAIFIINCNFGNEEAAGKIAQLMNLPTLLWGPRDRVIQTNGIRPADTQCGLFSISKQLRRYNVPFSYIENCDPEDKTFCDGFRRFLSVVCMVRNFKKLQVLQIGCRVKPFKCVMCNELELTERYGIDVIPINLAEVSSRVQKILSSRTSDLDESLMEIRKYYDPDGIDEETLRRMAALFVFYSDLEKEYGTNVMATECWSAMGTAVGAVPCTAMSLLANRGTIIACETDVYGAISSALLSWAARDDRRPFFGEFTVRHPSRDDAELLWHCGVFSVSVRQTPSQRLLTQCRPRFQARDGHYTLARFQAAEGKYYLLGGEFDTVDGPETTGTWLWAQFNNLAAIERKLIEGPYIHHVSEIEGHHSETLRDFTRFIPGLSFDPLEGNEG